MVVLDQYFLYYMYQYCSIFDNFDVFFIINVLNSMIMVLELEQYDFLYYYYIIVDDMIWYFVWFYQLKLNY